MINDKMGRPILSVIIPTRNRPKYVKSAITSILDIDDSRIELVIQDNSESNALLFWLKENISDKRLKYNYSSAPLSFVGNFSEGVELANGEYICIIGDDDGINPELIEAAEWLKKQDIDCLSTKISANFVWEDAEVPTTLFTSVTGGVLSISDISDRITQANVEDELLAFVKGGAINYLDFKLPKIYHGIVSAKCLAKVKAKTGSYFGGLSPDIFASLTLACVAKKVFVTDYPLTISGVCGVSASIVEGLLKKNSKKLEDAPHLRNRGEYIWSQLVPRVYCVETIWADSAIAALSAMGRDDLVNQINIPIFSAACVNANDGITDQVLSSLKYVSLLKGKKPFKSYIQYLWHLLLFKSSYAPRFVNRVFNRILIILNKKQYNSIDGLKDINQATIALKKYLAGKGILFGNLINRI